MLRPSRTNKHLATMTPMELLVAIVHYFVARVQQAATMAFERTIEPPPPPPTTATVTETVTTAGTTTTTELPERTLFHLRVDDTIPTPSPPNELAVYVAGTTDTTSALPSVFFLAFALLALFGIMTLLLLAASSIRQKLRKPELRPDAAGTRHTFWPETHPAPWTLYDSLEKETRRLKNEVNGLEKQLEETQKQVIDNPSNDSDSDSDSENGSANGSKRKIRRLKTKIRDLRLLVESNAQLRDSALDNLLESTKSMLDQQTTRNKTLELQNGKAQADLEEQMDGAQRSGESVIVPLSSPSD